MSELRIAVVGASGLMGRAVVRLAHGSGMKIVAGIATSDQGRDVGELAGVGPIGTIVDDNPRTLATCGAHVTVDFSHPSALAQALAVCAENGIAFVSGTTGLDESAAHAIDAASSRCAVLWEPNMSIGIHVLASLVEQTLRSLDASFDVEIVETHHRAKIDAPSGTALRLGEIVKSARHGRYLGGREGRPGPRQSNEIGMHAVRGGDVVGDHTVFFFGDGERLELTHRASSRDLFARGALHAATWMVGRPPGRYGLSDVLSKTASPSVNTVF